MTIENTNMGEQPIFTCKAHVFHIDPKTKRSWIPASSSAVSVSFYYDSTRQLHRIISVEGTKAVINSTVTSNMMFTKTSQKFGQWSDMRANTVYGLGFSTELELNKFIEKFKEVKESARSSGKTNGTIVVPSASIANAAASAIPTSAGTSSATASPLTTRGKHQDNISDAESLLASGLDHLSIPNSSESSLVAAHNAHQRSQSMSAGLQASASESPKHKTMEKPSVDTQVQLKYENDRLKLALAQSSANAKKWEIELNTLKTTNARLTSALQESTANVEEWKKQLQTYKEENCKMKNKLLELEAGGTRDVDEASQEIAMLRSRVESLEEELSNKNGIMEDLRIQLHRVRPDDLKETLQKLTEENEHLRHDVTHIQSELEVAIATQDSQRGVVQSVNAQLEDRIKDLLALHHELNHLLTT